MFNRVPKFQDKAKGVNLGEGNDPTSLTLAKTAIDCCSLLGLNRNLPPPSSLISSSIIPNTVFIKEENMSVTSIETESSNGFTSNNTTTATTAITGSLVGVKPALAPISIRLKKGVTVTRDLSAPNFGNDYSNDFVHHNILPQSHVQNIAHPFHDYPKLDKLHELKRAHFALHAHPPVGIRCPVPQIPQVIKQLDEGGAEFDVIMIGGCMNFSLKKLQELRIESIAARPSLLYLWVPSTEIASGRVLMEKWGFRHGEDITFMVTSLDSVNTPQSNPWSTRKPLFTQSTWHCLMGLKGTMRRSTDSTLINCNVDTDVIIEHPHQPRNVAPEQIYTLIENFTSMKRKLHIVPCKMPDYMPVRPRKGWVVMAPDTFSIGNLNPKDFNRRSLVPVSHDIDVLRPRTPPTQR